MAARILLVSDLLVDDCMRSYLKIFQLSGKGKHFYMLILSYLALSGSFALRLHLAYLCSRLKLGKRGAEALTSAEKRPSLPDPVSTGVGIFAIDRLPCAHGYALASLDLVLECFFAASSWWVISVQSLFT